MPAIRAVPSTSPFLALPARISLQRLGLHGHGALGDRGALGLGLAADIDHVGLAVGADMGEAPVSHRLRPRAAAGAPLSSARVAAATSACRIRLSPTRNVPMPAAPAAGSRHG